MYQAYLKVIFRQRSHA